MSNQPVQPSRRRFLKVGVVGFVALNAIGLNLVLDWSRLRSSLGWYAHRAREYVGAYAYSYMPLEERIRKFFDYLTIDDAGLRQFVTDFERRFGKPQLTSPRAQCDFYGQFLLATDFFGNGADESKMVCYIALYDPYVTLCREPFPPPGSD